MSSWKPTRKATNKTKLSNLLLNSELKKALHKSKASPPRTKQPRKVNQVVEV